MGNGFAPKEIIENGNHRLEVLSAETAETYGPQLAFKLRIIGGERDGHQFTDYGNRDEATGEVKQGSKPWSVFEACLGHGFHRNVSGLNDALDKLTGKQFMAQVTQTKTGSRNKVEHGTVGPVPPGDDGGSGGNGGGGSGSSSPNGGGLKEAQQQASQAANAPRDEEPPLDDADDPEWKSIPF